MTAKGGPPRGRPGPGPPERGPPRRPPGRDPPDKPLGVNIPENIWQWIVYLRMKIWNLQREAQINKIEISKSAPVATKAQKELDIAKFKAKKLSSVVGEPHRRGNRLEDLRSNGRDRLRPLDWGSLGTPT